MSLRRLLPVLAFAFAFAAGCKSPCVELAEKVCECRYPEGINRDNCNADAANKANALDITPEDEQACEALIDQCQCGALDTPEGKKSCGFAR